jgi:protein gp37
VRHAAWPLSNVALLVSAWNQESAEKYISELRACPAAVRGVSAEPLLGAMDLSDWLECSRDYDDAEHDRCDALDWVIVGGESGPRARPMQIERARSLRDQCVNAEVPFFFKQWGNWAPNASGEPVHHRTKAGGGRLLDGREWNEFPEAFR